MSQSLWSIGIFLCLLMCVPWLVKLVKDRNGVHSRDGDVQSRVVSAVAVGPQQRVVTVEVGPEHARTLLVLGVTAQSITCLHCVAKPPASLS